MTAQREIPTGIKKGVRIVECATGRELEVFQDYRATDVPISLHFQVLARYMDASHKGNLQRDERGFGQFQFSEIGKVWDYK